MRAWGIKPAKVSSNVVLSQSIITLLTLFSTDGNFVEYGSFENATSPSQSNNNLPESTNNSSTPIMNNNTSNTLQPSATAKRSTVRAQADEQRKKRDEIAAQAFLIAETDIDEAMTFAQNNLKFHFLQHSDKYVNYFTFFDCLMLGLHKIDGTSFQLFENIYLY